MNSNKFVTIRSFKIVLHSNDKRLFNSALILIAFIKL